MTPERKQLLSKVMKLAWNFIKNHNMSRSDAMKSAWSATRISSILRENKSLVFYFKKVDGSIRRAVGTLNKEVLKSVIPNFVENGVYQSKRQQNTKDVQIYFDLEKNEWRRFKISNFIKTENA